MVEGSYFNFRGVNTEMKIGVGGWGRYKMGLFKKIQG